MCVKANRTNYLSCRLSLKNWSMSAECYLTPSQRSWRTIRIFYRSRWALLWRWLHTGRTSTKSIKCCFSLNDHVVPSRLEYSPYQHNNFFLFLFLIIHTRSLIPEVFCYPSSFERYLKLIFVEVLSMIWCQFQRRDEWPVSVPLKWVSSHILLVTLNINTKIISASWTLAGMTALRTSAGVFESY